MDCRLAQSKDEPADIDRSRKRASFGVYAVAAATLMGATYGGVKLCRASEARDACFESKAQVLRGHLSQETNQAARASLYLGIVAENSSSLQSHYIWPVYPAGFLPYIANIAKAGNAKEAEVAVSQLMDFAWDGQEGRSALRAALGNPNLSSETKREMRDFLSLRFPNCD